MPSKLPWHRFKQAAEGAAAALGDAPWKLRYGVGPTEKYAAAVSGEIPGAEKIEKQADVPREERRAAGYLFGKNWPTLARGGTALANKIRFSEDPALHSVATSATEQGIADAQMEPPPGWRQAAESALMVGGLGPLIGAYNKKAAPPAGAFTASASATSRRRR